MFLNSLLAFGISAAVILLQLVQTRVFSVLFWSHLVYFIISIALLGFGISGTWLSLGNTKLAIHLTKAKLTIYFVLFSILTTLVIPSLHLPFIDSSVYFQFVIYGFAVLPYFFAGWMLGVLFRDHAEKMNILYFADLIGAAIGCLLYVFLMQMLGVVGLTILACFLVVIPSFLTLQQSKQRNQLILTCASLIGIISFFYESIDTNIKPKTPKAIITKYQGLKSTDQKVVEFSEWNTISRIDVVSTTNNPSDKKIYIDGDAWTHILPNPENPAPAFNAKQDILMFNKSPYLLGRKIQKALVIGAGGGVDVWHALRGGATQIDAIEINPTTRQIGLEHYKSFNNHLFHRKGVTLYNEEGRSFIRNSHDQYDLIMIHAIDTFAALNSGAYMLSENYLYTVEAFQDYIQHLSPDGILCMTRWDHPGEATRLFTTSLEALYTTGTSQPFKNILAINAYDPEITFVSWMTVLLQKTPFTAAEINLVNTYASKHQSHLVYPVHNPTTDIQKWSADFVKSKEEHKEKEFFQSIPFDVRPTTDDSPFFFNYERWKGISKIFSHEDINPLIKTNLTTFILFLLTFISVALFIFIPLRKIPTVDQPKNIHIWTIYFSCLGISFIFVEISLMQRFALFLGHPSRSIALILGTLLFTAGIGSYFSSFVTRRPKYFFMALMMMVLISGFVYPKMIHYFLGYSLVYRAWIAIAMVSPLGFLMGMPFPAGIQCLSREHASSVPWMWGINGGTTVLGSITAIVLAITFGFTKVLLLAAVSYAIAAVIYFKIQKLSK